MGHHWASRGLEGPKYTPVPQGLDWGQVRPREASLWGNKAHPYSRWPLQGQRSPTACPGSNEASWGLKGDIYLRGRRKSTLRMLLGTSIINPLHRESSQAPSMVVTCCSHSLVPSTSLATCCLWELGQDLLHGMGLGGQPGGPCRDLGCRGSSGSVLCTH